MENATIRTAILSELKTVLRIQKYPSKIIKAGIKKASEMTFEVLRAEKNVLETPI